jgi:hypothetical protein
LQCPDSPAMAGSVKGDPLFQAGHFGQFAQIFVGIGRSG